MHHRLAVVTLIAAASTLATHRAEAWISPGITVSGINAPFYNGNGELFMSVTDSAAQVSYTLDLGITQNEFFTLGQADAGYQRFWAVTDANWTNFLAQTSEANRRWAVMAHDSIGGSAVGAVRLFTTVQQGQEGTDFFDVSKTDPNDPTRILGFTTLTNQQFSVAMGSSQAGTFFSAINTTGTHGAVGSAPDYSTNGSSVNANSDPGNAYFGEGGVGLTPNYNGNTAFFNTNEIGKSSWFYYLTRSGTDQLGYTIADEFDNLTADGYWGFTFVDAQLYPDSPYAGQYLLSYTMQGMASTQALVQREFAAGIGRTEGNGGFRITRLDGVAVAKAGEGPAGWSNRLGSLDIVASPVPEPGTWLMLGAGLALLVARRRR